MKMKDLVLLPLRYVAVLIVCLILSSAVQVLVDFSQLPVQIMQRAEPVFWPLAFNALTMYVLPSIGMTWLVLAFHILHKKRLRGLLLLFLCALSIGGTFGALNVYRLFAQMTDGSGIPSFTVPVNTILSFEEGHTVVGNDDTEKISNLIFHGNSVGDRFIFVESAQKDFESRSLIFPEQGLTVNVGRILGGRSAMFEAPGFFSDFSQAISRSSAGYFSAGGESWLTMIIFATGFSIGLSGLWLLVRVSKWPLFNFMLSILALIGLFLVGSLLSEPIVADLIGLLPADIAFVAVPGLLAVLGLFAMGINLFLSPAKDWQRDGAS